MEFHTEEPIDIVDITDRVAGAIPPDIDSGVCTVFVQHTTAGVIVNEAEAGLLEDLQGWLETAVDGSATYRHDCIDDNAPAHLRSVLLGSSATVPIRAGDLDFGTWQRILLVEADGPRTRSVRVTVSESL